MRIGNNMWLNDEVINTYLARISATNMRTNYITTEVIQRYGWKGKLTDKWQSVYHWKLSESDTILVPINIGNAHWAMVILRVRERSLLYMDSLNPHQPSISDTFISQILY